MALRRQVRPGFAPWSRSTGHVITTRSSFVACPSWLSLNSRVKHIASQARNLPSSLLLNESSRVIPTQQDRPSPEAPDGSIHPQAGSATTEDPACTGDPYDCPAARRAIPANRPDLAG